MGTLPRPYLTPTMFGSSERQGGRPRPQTVTMSNVKPTPKDHQERASRAFPQRTVSSRRPYQGTDMLNKFINILFICPCGSHAHTHLLYSPSTLLPWRCLISPLHHPSSSISLVATGMSKLQFPPLYHACVSKCLAAQGICLIPLIRCIIFLPAKHNCKIFPNMDGLIIILFLSHTYNRIHLLYLLLNLTSFHTQLQ